MQSPLDEQGAISVESLWSGVTNHESLRTTVYILVTQTFRERIILRKMLYNQI